jgi:hypothetical protein
MGVGNRCADRAKHNGRGSSSSDNHDVRRIDAAFAYRSIRIHAVACSRSIIYRTALAELLGLGQASCLMGLSNLATPAVPTRLWHCAVRSSADLKLAQISGASRSKTSIGAACRRNPVIFRGRVE